jgi:hypothetical protein
VWAAPSAGVLSRSAADQSASTYLASEVSSRPRWRYRAPVLINSSASRAVFDTRLPERRLAVRPSRRHPLANPACPTGAFAPTERISTRPRIPRWRQTVSCTAALPRRSSPACWPRRRPRHCDGQPMGERADEEGSFHKLEFLRRSQFRRPLAAPRKIP